MAGNTGSNVLSRFSNLQIGQQLAVGNGSVLALLLVLAGVSYFAVGNANSSFTEYRLTARQTNAVNALNGDLSAARTAAKSFIINNDDASAKQTHERLSTSIESCKKAHALFSGLSGLDKIDIICREIEDYRDAFGKLESHVAKGNELEKELDTVGPLAEKAATEILRGAAKTNNIVLVDAAGETVRALLLARLYIAKYRHTSDTTDMNRVQRELESFNTHLAQLDKSVPSGAMRSVLSELKGLETSYAQTFDRLIVESEGEQKITSGTLDVLGPDVARRSAELVESNETRQNEIGPRAAKLLDRTISTSLILSALSITIGIALSVFIARSITRPIVSMTNAMRTLADGNKNIQIPGTQFTNEVGAMAAAVQVFKENMIRADELAAQQDAERKAKEERVERVATRTRQFDSVVRLSLGSVGTASKQMEASASTMQAVAEETNAQSSAVAAASEQAASNVQTVAAATEELTSSIKEIGRQMTQSSQVAAKAVEDANKAKDMVRSLDESAQKIGKVVALITDIAEQTNLLALNATIEAARAGEAGKGFAVVASEVKNLANQTAKATEEISTQITGIQGATKSSVSAIENIFQTIGQIDQIATTIASAIEEQTAATAEIARNVEQAAAGTQEVSTNIVGVTEAAGEAGQVSTQVLTAAKELASQAESLRSEVDSFLSDIREAA